MSLATAPVPAVLPPARNQAGFWSNLARPMLIAVGWVLIVLSPFVGILPGPGGIPVFVAGAVLVLRNSRGARRWFIRLQRRHPKWVSPLRRMLKKRPDLAPWAWQTVLKIERTIVPRSWRAAADLRRRFRGPRG
ncbi:MAG: hypothetical protein U1E50_09950 [Caulobacteraceae bacterium]